MQHTRKTNDAPWLSMAAVALGWALAGSAALAQPPATPLTLTTLFDRAWAQQPEAQSAALRRESAQAARSGASSWTAEPAALELQAKTDRPGSNQGSREYEVGVALPLWLPGERARKAALGDAEIKAVDSRRLAAQLQLAATVREAWWALQRAQAELGLAQDRLQNAERLAADVARRFKAGDMSRADQSQADGAVAQAEAAVAEAMGARDAAQAALAVWGGGAELADGAEPEAVPGAGLPADHPAVADWQDQAEVARRAADLAAVQTRANPELTVAATRGSVCAYSVSSPNRWRMMVMATAFLMPSSQLPCRRVVKPTQDEKSSARWASQCCLKRAGDHCPPANTRAVWPPAEPPKTPTLSSASSGARRASCATASTARETSAGRRFQLSGPGVEWSL